MGQEIVLVLPCAAGNGAASKQSLKQKPASKPSSQNQKQLNVKQHKPSRTTTP